MPINKYFNLHIQKLGAVIPLLLKVKRASLYLLIVSLCFIVNFFYYQYLFKNQSEKDTIILKAYMNDISTVVINDIKQSLNGNKGLLFFSNFYTNKTPTNDDSYINSKGDHVYVITPKNILVLNKQRFLDFMKQSLPPYVNFQVLLNRFNIAQSHINIADNKDTPKNTGIREKYDINKNNSLIIKLEINPKHPDYLSSIKNLYINALLTLLISISSAVGLLHLYLKQRQRFKTRIRNLETQAALAEQIKNALINKLQSEQSLRKLFIKNATSIYLENNIPNMSASQKRLNELSSFLFPIAFTEPANDEEIDVKEIIEDLTEYTAFEATQYDISFDKQVDMLKVQCSSIVLYQVLFSLVSNLIRLMPPVSDSRPTSEAKKKFTVTFLAEKIIIDYQTFPLNADNIAGFLHKKGLDAIDAFFLDYRRILESLKNHKIDYTISTEPTGNRFELDLKKKTPKGKPNLRLVE